MEVTAPKGTTVNQAADKIKNLFIPPQEEKVTEEVTEPTEITEESEVEAQTEVQTYKVKVDGDEIDVPLDELLKGYSRTADYTRKTQKVSEKAKALEAEESAVKAEREQYTNALKLLEGQLKSQEENIDWARLEQEDPIAFATKKLKERDRRDQLLLVQQEQQRVAHLQADEQRKALEKYVQEEQAKLADVIPEWKDAKVAKAEKEKLSGFLEKLGYSQAEISQIYDHRAVVALRKAYLYDEMMSGAKTKVEKAKDSPKTSRPGNLQPQRSKDYVAAREQFAKTGKVDDFVSAFKKLSQKR
jgi:hypothetical protein